MRKNIIIGLLLLISCLPASAQDSVAIFLRTRVQKDAILLRWAASTPMAWKQTNRSGFRIERYTVVRNNVLLDTPQLMTLPLQKAQPLEEWMPLVEENDNAGVVAQALYGEEFELTGQDAQGLARIINLAQELEQRFTFALYAADQDFSVACMAGWGWRDTTVEKGERYLYRVTSGAAADSGRMAPGIAYVSLDEYKELLRPAEIIGIWGDKSVMLSWNYGRLANNYNSYYIEKSTDGKNFTRLPGRPVSNLNNREDRLQEKLVYIDTVANNKDTYYYRVLGITPFGEEGPVSEVVSGKGITPLVYVPSILKSVVNDEGALEMDWEFDERGNELLQGFELLLSDQADGEYQTIMKDIRPEKRTLKFKELRESNYLKIKAVPYEGKPTISYPVLIQPLDTTPPAVPSGLKGRIDSTGIVYLSWDKNTEADFLGYIVYRTHRAGDEPVSLFDVAWRDTCFVDTVKLENLNPMTYYYVLAVDKRYNQSHFSVRLDLKKPDVIPPLSPLFSGYKITDKGIELTWIPSPDKDVTEHNLYRLVKGRDSVPECIVRIPGNSVDRYVDTVFTPDTRYVYTVFAVDEGGLTSQPTPSLTVVSPKVGNRQKQIDRFDAIVDREHMLIKLTWSPNLQHVRSYEVYRSEGEAPLSLWKVVSGWQTDIMDENVVVGVKYSYLLRALFETGGNSQSKSIIIER